MLQLKTDVTPPEIRFIRPIITRNLPLSPSWSQAAIILLLVAGIVAAIGYCTYKPTVGVFDGFNPFLVAMANDVWHTQPVDRRAFLFAHKLFLIMLGLSIFILGQVPGPLKFKWTQAKLLFMDACAIGGLLSFLAYSFLRFEGWEKEQLIGSGFCACRVSALQISCQHIEVAADRAFSDIDRICHMSGITSQTRLR